MENLKHTLSRLGLGQADLEYICSKFKCRKYAKNDYLINVGQIADKIFFIEKGSVILGNELKDQSITRHLAKENEFITCLDSFSRQTTSTEFLKATEPTEVYTLLKKEMDDIRNGFPVVEKFYNQFIFDTLIKCQHRIKDLISLDARAYYEEIARNNPDFLQKMPLYDLASFMGIEPQSLSRLRKNIE